MNVLSIRNLSKSFGQQQIIKNLNMSVPEGSVFGFIGQNGRKNYDNENGFGAFAARSGRNPCV